MEKLQLTTCCGRFSLKTGTIFIGVSEIVLTSIFLIIISVTNEEESEDIIVTADDDGQDTKVKYVLYVVSNCISILISALLITGAIKKNTCLMLPWLILKMIGIIGLSMYVISVMVISFINSQVFIGIFVLVIGLIIIMISLYIWLAAYSYFTELKIEELNNRLGREPL